MREIAIVNIYNYIGQIVFDEENLGLFLSYYFTLSL